MNNKLALKLKKAGFPQKLDKSIDATFNGIKVIKHEDPNPTLSELIKACGNDIDLLFKMYEKEKFLGWSAVRGDRKKSGQGKNPTEAVANLWLKLNS